MFRARYHTQRGHSLWGFKLCKFEMSHDIGILNNVSYTHLCKPHRMLLLFVKVRIAEVQSWQIECIVASIYTMATTQR